LIPSIGDKIGAADHFQVKLIEAIVTTRQINSVCYVFECGVGLVFRAILIIPVFDWSVFFEYSKSGQRMNQWDSQLDPMISVPGQTILGTAT
jgi:hypothetical protein